MSRHRTHLLALIGFALTWVLGAGCSMETDREVSPSSPQTPAAQIRFTDISSEVGLDFTHVSGTPEQRFIIESMGGGVAFLDYDDDTYLDVFVVDGTRLEAPPPTATNRLFRNAAAPAGGGRRFHDVTEQTGLRRTGWGMGCATGDVDGDGHVDLYVTYWGTNLLYRNEAGRRFSDVTRTARVGDPRWGASAAFGDLDADGDLDLYVTNYLAFDLASPPNDGEPCSGWKGLDVFCGPHGLQAQSDVLFRNDGDGSFTDVSVVTGIDAYRLPALGVLFADTDGDGDQDLYVANDSRPNLLFRNDGGWRLTEIGPLAGVALSEDGRPQAGMGVAAGDYDRDTDLDLFVTNFSDDVNTLYRNLGDGTFVDATFEAGLGGLVRPFLGWSTALFDADNDGWLDLFVANGHLYPQLSAHASGLRYAQHNLLYRNEGGRFTLLAPPAQLGGVQVSRGTAFGDFDNDGDTDLLTTNLNGPPLFLRNDGGAGHHWLGLELVGRPSNREGLGARVLLTAGGQTRVREVRSAYGYLSAHDPRVVFGLGALDRVDRVEIRWPSGSVQILEDPPVGRYLVVHEGAAGVGDEYVAQTEAARPPLSRTVAAASPAVPSVHGGAATGSAAENERRGLAYYRAGRYDEALAVLRVAARQRPGRIDTRYALGLVLYAGLGRFQEAAEELEQVVRLDTARADVRELLGAVYLGLNQPQRAIQMLQVAARLKPAAWRIHHRLGLAYIRQGLTEEAAGALRQAARLAPYVPQVHLDLARLYRRQNNTEAARREMSSYERWAPVAERAAYYEQQVRQDAAALEAYYYLGQAYAEQGRFGEAVARFRTAIEMDSTYAEAYYGLGAVMHLRGDLTQAVEAYQKAVGLRPNLFLAQSDLGQAYYQLGRFEQAVAAYRQALARGPDLPVTYSKLGLALAQDGKLEEAIRSFAQALRRDSSLVDTRDALARAYAAAGRFEEAIEQWRLVLRQDADYPHVADFIRRAQVEGTRSGTGAPD